MLDNAGRAGFAMCSTTGGQSRALRGERPDCMAAVSLGLPL
jgi:hypothetical protein